MNKLIIFVKNPRLGEVKTRLAKDVGEDKALKVYHELLQYTKTVCDTVEVEDLERNVVYDKFIPAQDLFSNARYESTLQRGAHLGDRMLHAFGHAFNYKADKAIIIGSDCFDITTKHIEEAFKALDDHDVVVGPAEDGGYYLLGMKKLHASLFRNKTWSSEKLLEETETNLQELSLSYHYLERLNDIDTIEDLKKANYDHEKLV